VGHAVHVRVDAQGRVRVHSELLKWAGIPAQHGSDGREIKIIGVGAYLELWACGVYESRRQSSEADFEDTFDEMLQEQSAQSGTATIEGDGDE
jgi:DNA-binding transcriptional regulator/RsmH inhibitor MraZ